MPEVGGNSGDASQMFDAVVKYSGKMGGTTVNANVGYGETQGTAANSNKLVADGRISLSGRYHVLALVIKETNKDTGKEWYSQ